MLYIIHVDGGWFVNVVHVVLYVCVNHDMYVSHIADIHVVMTKLYEGVGLIDSASIPW